MVVCPCFVVALDVDKPYHTTGGRATFFCHPSVPARDVRWLFNGTCVDPETYNNSNVRVGFDRTANVGQLVIDELTLEFNATAIQCEVTLPSGMMSLSENRTLLIQGI